MNITWTIHAQERFIERVIKYGLAYGDFENQIRKQIIKIKIKDKIKTIFKINEILFVVIKKENSKYLRVITLWEATKEEEDIYEHKNNMWFLWWRSNFKI